MMSNDNNDDVPYPWWCPIPMMMSHTHDNIPYPWCLQSMNKENQFMVRLGSSQQVSYIPLCNWDYAWNWAVISVVYNLYRWSEQPPTSYGGGLLYRRYLAKCTKLCRWYSFICSNYCRVAETLEILTHSYTDLYDIVYIITKTVCIDCLNWWRQSQRQFSTRRAFLCGWAFISELIWMSFDIA